MPTIDHETIEQRYQREAAIDAKPDDIVEMLRREKLEEQMRDRQETINDYLRSKGRI